MDNVEFDELTVGNCNCLIKSPNPIYHDKRCPIALVYRIKQLEDEIQELYKDIDEDY